MEKTKVRQVMKGGDSQVGALRGHNRARSESEVSVRNSIAVAKNSRRRILATVVNLCALARINEKLKPK